MKYLFIIILLLTSCIAPKTFKSHKSRSGDGNTGGTSTSTSSSEYQMNDSLDEKLDYLSSVKEESPKMVYPKDYPISYQMTSATSAKGVPIKKISVKNTNIKNSLDSVITSGSTRYYIPDNMEVRNSYKIYVDISRTKILIREISPEKKVTKTTSIPVTENMEVNLVDNSAEDSKAFSIVKENTSIQFMSDSSVTSWNWTVVPLKSGSHNLSVVISIIKNGIKKDTVYEDTVNVKVNIKNQLLFFLNQYWQWLMSTLVIPIFVWLWKRKKKDKD